MSYHKIVIEVTYKDGTVETLDEGFHKSAEELIEDYKQDPDVIEIYAWEVYEETIEWWTREEE